MSFSADVKEELCRSSFGKKHSLRAELYGILLFCNRFTETELKIVTGSMAFAKRLPLLLQKAFKLSFDQLPKEEAKTKLSFVVNNPAKLAILRSYYGVDHASPALHINFAMVEEHQDQAAFFRGAFLACGSVNDPTKSYHLELSTSHYSVSRELTALLPEMGFQAKQTLRKANYITYFKQSDTIADFLTAIGAPLSAMDLMNAKVEKHLRSRVNRSVNCDSANMDKSVIASVTQAQAIQRLQATGGLDSLPEKLQQTALLRLEYPELTLSQLAEISTPPVTKSCLNHRLRKLLELAGELRIES